EARVVGNLAGRHHVAGRLLSVLAGQDTTARGAATGGGVALRKAHTSGGQSIKIGGVDLTAVATGVGIAHVIGENDQKVGPLGRRCLRSFNERSAGGDLQKRSSRRLRKGHWHDSIVYRGNGIKITASSPFASAAAPRHSKPGRSSLPPPHCHSAATIVRD